MDWKSVKFDWNRARAFLVTAEEGSLSAAARALGMAQPTLGRQVTALEEQLGVVLFERVGKRLTLTQSGIDMLEHVKAMGSAAGRVSLTASGQSQSIEGNVCISASEIHAAYLLPSIIAKLRKTEPGITIEIVSSNSASDLQRREADIAIRSFRPTQPELISKKIKDVDAPFYAAKSYLKHIGKLETLDDLQNAHFITIGNINLFMKGLNDSGLNLTKNNFPIQSESHIVHWELVKKGLGIGIVPEDIGTSEKTVVRVLPDIKPISFPIWLTSHRELRTSKRIRLVFDFIANELS